uniref:Uncharacterized protein n=1 Tax=Ciona savignyi TaxID=51511 RepID=H2YP97_CIOSA
MRKTGKPILKSSVSFREPVDSGGAETFKREKTALFSRLCRQATSVNMKRSINRMPPCNSMKPAKNSWLKSSECGLLPISEENHIFNSEKGCFVSKHDFHGNGKFGVRRPPEGGATEHNLKKDDSEINLSPFKLIRRHHLNVNKGLGFNRENAFVQDL